MARSEELAQESLEMLLDTICNTFGAVLFIAMLVVTLVNPNATEQTDRGSVDAEFAETTTQINSMQIETERLQLVLQQQLELKRQFSDVDSQQLSEQLTAAKQQRARLIQNRAGSLSQLVATGHQNFELREQIRQQGDLLSQTKVTAADVSKRLSDQARKNGRVAKTPKTVRLRTQTIGTLLQGGIWYCLTKPNALGTIEVNLSHCNPVSNGTHQTLKPKPGAGVNVRNSTAKLVPFQPADPQSHHFTLFVYQDSCEEYRAVRDALAEAGFRVELILMDDEDYPVFGPGAGQDRWGA